MSNEKCMYCGQGRSGSTVCKSTGGHVFVTESHFLEPVTARPDGQLETELTELKEIVTAPIDMIIFCPSCHFQHIDRPDPECRKPDHLGPDGDEPCRRSKGHTGQCMCSPMDDDVVRWTNPAHKSHTCRTEDGGCGIIFRVADVPTNGVTQLKTIGSDDTWLPESVQESIYSNGG